MIYCPTTGWYRSNLRHEEFTYVMKASSSLLVALIGGPDSFDFVLPPIARAVPPKTVPRVIIASYERSHESALGSYSLNVDMVDKEKVMESSLLSLKCRAS